MSVLFWLIDHALGYGVALIFTVAVAPADAPDSVAARRRADRRCDLHDRLAGRHGARARSPLVIGTAFAFTWIPAGSRRWAHPARLRAVAFVYPFFAARLFTIPFFGAFPDVASGTGTYMMVFMMMAVGLNIVVGYAGLLDLGYVAFYAIGAYVDGLVRVLPVPGPEVPEPPLLGVRLPGRGSFRS